MCIRDSRDPGQSAKEIAPGETGTIAVLDALSTSYPGFLLTDDIGDVETGTCGCGRTGQVINFRRRGQGDGLGHCPVSIERYLGSGTTAEAEAPARQGRVTVMEGTDPWKRRLPSPEPARS